VAETSYPKFLCVVFSETGKAEFSVDGAVLPPGSPVSILIPARSLRPGIYTLRIRGIGEATAGPEIDHYSFRLQLR